jgi:ribosomal protein S18 acetylase RimI-like enzyme
MSQSSVIVEKAVEQDLDRILSLQKLAFREAGERYGIWDLPPLTQTHKDIAYEFTNRLFLKAVLSEKLVGSVRAHVHGDTCYVGRLVVHPDYQNRGLGCKLMNDIESRFPGASRFEVFTGFRDEKNLYLYEKLGYRRFREQAIDDRLTMIYLEKHR